MKFTYIGIDIAKDDFVSFVRFSNSKPSAFKNSTKGINKFINKLPDNPWCFMEATGVYSIRLATALYEKGIRVSVINPLQIKRFAQTKLKRAKTDRVDAHLIAEYGDKMKPQLFTPIPHFIHQLQQKRALVRQLIKTRSALKNQLKTFKQLPNPDEQTLNGCQSMIQTITEQLENIELQMVDLTNLHCKKLFHQLQTIPGISTKASLELIIVSGMFKNFYSAKQFSAFIGICPSINESGKSIRGYRGISRIGSSYTRAILYLCTMNDFRYNAQCKALYDRLTANGKPGKVALIAVANKLIRQVFGMVKSGENYCSQTDLNTSKR